MKQYRPNTWAQSEKSGVGEVEDAISPSRGEVDLTEPLRSKPAGSEKKTARFRRRLTWLILPAVFLGAVGFQMGTESTYISSYLANALFENNFHEVVPGKLFRSAQMSRYELIETLRVNGIKTVIDLRINEDEPDDTGLTEAAAVNEGGAVYRHIPFSSSRIDQRRSLLALLAAYSEVQTPILVHCSSGTHRSGVAAAMWLIDKEGQSPEQAAGQLTMKYGFFQPERDLKAFLQGRPTLDRVITEYAAALRKKPVSFQEWVVRSPILGTDALKEVGRQSRAGCLEELTRPGPAFLPTRLEEKPMTPVCQL